MSQLKNQDRDNSDSGYHAQKHHTAQHSVILNPRTSISPEDDDPTELVSQTGGLRDKSEDDDMTASHVDQDRWSLENLPDILYVLKPEQPKSRHVIRTTAHVVFGKHINVFAVLPDQISSKVEGWRLEAWLRLDRRITVQDIIDRVNPKYRFRLTPADIELRRKTFREKFHVACWGAQKSVNDVYRRAASMGINPSLNSTRGLTPGLIDPSKGEAGGRIPLPPRAACDDHSDSGLLVQSQLLAQSSQSNPLATRLIEEPYKSHKTHSSDTIYQLHWDTKHSSKKRGPVADRFNIANPLLKRHSSHDVASHDYPATCKRRNRMSAQPGVFDFNSYPATLLELASHKGPPARVFSTEGEAVERTMSLDEYLHGRQLTFWEYLDLRCENRLSDIKRWSLRSWG